MEESRPELVQTEAHKPNTSREQAASPVAATEAILITGVIEAKQCRDIMNLDIPNAFVQTVIPQDGDKVVMKIRGPLVDFLCELVQECMMTL